MARMVRLWYGYGMAKARLSYDNPDVSVRYGTITWMSVLPDYVLLGEEASLPNLEGKRLYPGDPCAFLLKVKKQATCPAQGV